MEVTFLKDMLPHVASHSFNNVFIDSDSELALSQCPIMMILFIFHLHISHRCLDILVENVLIDKSGKQAYDDINSNWRYHNLKS